MLFNSYQFLIFFPIVVLIYYVLPDRIKYLWLLVTSYYFYICWNAKYALWIFTSTVITYISGLLIEKVKKLHSTESKRIHLKKIIVVCNEVRQQVKHLFFSFRYIWQEVFQHDVWKKISEHSQLSRSHRNGFVVYWTWRKSPL